MFRSQCVVIELVPRRVPESLQPRSRAPECLGPPSIRVMINLDRLIGLNQQPAMAVLPGPLVVVAGVSGEVKNLAHPLEWEFEGTLTKLVDELAGLFGGGRS